MMRKTFLMWAASVLLIVLPQASYGHSFSTSFLRINAEGGITYQIAFGDLVVLNQQWLQGQFINDALLNSNLDHIERFLQRTVIVNQQQCTLRLNEQQPWSVVSVAHQNYMVIAAHSDCAVSNINHIKVANLWQEFPDHKVITEISLPQHSLPETVLSVDSPALHFGI